MYILLVEKCKDDCFYQCNCDKELVVNYVARGF